MNIGLLMIGLISMAGGMTAAQTPSPETIEPRRVFHHIDSVALESFSNDAGVLTQGLRITGQQPDSSDFPVIITQARLDDWLVIDIYREIPQDEPRLASPLPYDALIPLDDADFVVVEVNDYLAVQSDTESAAFPRVQRDWLTVQQVDVQMTQDQVRFDVTVQMPQECAVPYRTWQQRDNRMLTVGVYYPRAEIFQEQCQPVTTPQVIEIPIEDDLAAGVYLYSSRRYTQPRTALVVDAANVPGEELIFLNLAQEIAVSFSGMYFDTISLHVDQTRYSLGFMPAEGHSNRITIERFETEADAQAAFELEAEDREIRLFHGHPSVEWNVADENVEGSTSQYMVWQAEQWLFSTRSFDDTHFRIAHNPHGLSETVYRLAVEVGLFE